MDLIMWQANIFFTSVGFAVMCYGIGRMISIWSEGMPAQFIGKIWLLSAFIAVSGGFGFLSGLMYLISNYGEMF